MLQSSQAVDWNLQHGTAKCEGVKCNLQTATVHLFCYLSYIVGYALFFALKVAVMMFCWVKTQKEITASKRGPHVSDNSSWSVLRPIQMRIKIALAWLGGVQMREQRDSLSLFFFCLVTAGISDESIECSFRTTRLFTNKLSSSM